MYMLIPKIWEHASLLYVLESAAHLGSHTICMHYIYISMLPKFFYTHTYKSQVLQWFLGFIIIKTIIKFVKYGLRIFAGFIYNGILFLLSI
jgi:hypothetical protein